jgi:hypothetical protein
MSTEGEILRVSVLPYRCSTWPPLVTYRAPDKRFSHTLDSLGRWPHPDCSFRSTQVATVQGISCTAHELFCLQVVLCGTWSEMVLCGTRSEMVLCGTWSEMVLYGTWSEMVLCGTRSEMVLCGTRSEMVLCGTWSEMVLCGTRSEMVVWYMVRNGSVRYTVRNLGCTVTIDSVLVNSKTHAAFLFPVHAMFRHDCPLAVKPGSTPRCLVHTKKTLRFFTY